MNLQYERMLALCYVPRYLELFNPSHSRLR